MAIRFIPIPTGVARSYRNGAPDAYGIAPEKIKASTGSDTPCRHCMRQVPAGKSYLIIAYRPFTGLNPYTETGPVFICAGDCPAGGRGFPAQMLSSPLYIVRGYSANERIIGGTGSVVMTEQIVARCETLFARSEVAFIHIRSASNNCLMCRAERA